MEALRWGGSGKVRRITLAPELPGALELIRRLREKGFLVTGGHTAATMEETLAGIEAGISSATHLFNGMAPFHHRQPGPAGAYLSQRRVGCELIADGIHLHPLVLRLVLKCKGMEGAFAVSDATPAAGLPPGRYRFDERWISVDEAGACRLPDGTLAGGSFSMAEICAFFEPGAGLDGQGDRLAGLHQSGALGWPGEEERGFGTGPGGGYSYCRRAVPDPGLLDKGYSPAALLKHPGRQKGGREAPRQQSLPGAAAGGPLWPGVPDTETRCHKGKSFGEKSFCCGKRKARQIKTAAATRQEAGQILIS